jgi:hypothetical protein
MVKNPLNSVSPVEKSVSKILYFSNSLISPATLCPLSTAPSM